jgi:hypothetical protein
MERTRVPSVVTQAVAGTRRASLPMSASYMAAPEAETREDDEPEGKECVVHDPIISAGAHVHREY